MRLEIDDVGVARCDTNSWNDLLAQYRASEQASGREVPSYNWESLAGLIAGWLLKKLADEVWKRLADHVAGKVKTSDTAHGSAASEAMSAEVLARLASLEVKVASDGDAALQLIKAAVAHGLRVTVVLESDADHDLRESLLLIVPRMTIAERDEGSISDGAP